MTGYGNGLGYKFRNIGAVKAGADSVFPITNKKVGLVFVTGNSHSIGRISALPGDAFASKVWEYTQSAAVAKPQSAILDVGDTSGNYSTTHYSPFVTFLADLVAARTDLDHIVVIAQGQGSTGFVDGTWSVANIAAPNRLANGVSRYNAAHAALLAHGNTLEAVCAVHLSSKPDSDISAADSPTMIARVHAYAQAQDDYIDYVRANLSGFSATTPVIVSMAMTLEQVTAEGTNHHIFAAAGNGSPWRKAYTWFMDPINDWGYGVAGLPVVPFDGTHANHDGEITKGHLLYQGYTRALTNTAPSAPFSALNSWSACESLYDFRAGEGRDKKGSYDLVGAGSAPPLVRYDSKFGTRVFDRPSGTGRVWKRQQHLPASYTWFMRLSLDALARTHGLFNNTDTVSGSEALYRAYINSSNQMVVGHGASAQITQALALTANTVFDLAISYDGTTLKLYKDGALITSAAAGAVDNQRGLYVGSQTNAFTNVILGDIQSLAVYNTALTDAQILALHQATYTR